MGKQNYFFSGITDILILAILCEHDSYVYEIVKFIKEKSNGCLSISQNEGRAYYEKLLESFHNAYSGVESILNILKEDKGNEQ